MERRLKAYDVLAMRADLTKRMIEPDWVLYMDAFLADVARKSGGGYRSVSIMNPETGEKLDVSSGGAWCLSEYQALIQADSYLIGAHMNPLIRMAAADIPEDILLEEHMLPSKYGFLVFEEPWATIDVSGRHLLTRAVTWQYIEDQHGKSGVQVTEYSAFSDNDEVTRQIREIALSQTKFKNYTEVIGDLQVQHLMPLKFGTSILLGTDPDWNDDQIRAAVGPVRAMLALWMLMQQRVTETVVPVLTPRSAARWTRKRVKPAVNVINLRRRRIVSHSADETGSAGRREWSGRWMVRGHWRQQPYGPKRQDRHWVYIHPFLKGPDDKPLIDKRPRVYKLSR